MLDRRQFQLTTHQDQSIVVHELQVCPEFSLQVLNYGGILWSLNLPDRQGQVANVLVQHPQFEPDNPGYLGAITGRFAGRINRARFRLGQQEYQVAANQGPHCLHGGPQALEQQLWQVSPLEDGLELRHTSPAGHNGFPGTLDLKVRYRASLTTKEDFPYQLLLEFQAESDQLTPVNLAHHLYFDLTATRGVLGGGAQGRRQELRLDSQRYGVTDDQGAFLGQLWPVEGTPFDFRTPKALGRDLPPGGYDHPWLLRSSPWPLGLEDPVSGRRLRGATSEPVVVVYSANHFAVPGTACCLETQRWPNAINLEDYRDSVLVGPGRPYRSWTRWQFGN